MFERGNHIMESNKELKDEREMQALKEFYKKSIVEMSGNMDNLDYLAKSYHYMLARYQKEKGAKF